MNLHTVSRPVPPASALHRANAADLGPHVAGGVPGVDVRALGHLGHVELDGAEMRHGRVGDEPERAAGLDGRYPLPGRHLEARHVGAVDVRHAEVPLVVFRLPDGGPFRRFALPVDLDLRESVCAA